jgi:hypothetical protein
MASTLIDFPSIFYSEGAPPLTPKRNIILANYFLHKWRTQCSETASHMLLLYKITARSVKDSFNATIAATLPTFISSLNSRCNFACSNLQPLPPFLCSVVNKFLPLINSIRFN